VLTTTYKEFSNNIQFDIDSYKQFSIIIQFDIESMIDLTLHKNKWMLVETKQNHIKITLNQRNCINPPNQHHMPKTYYKLQEQLPSNLSNSIHCYIIENLQLFPKHLRHPQLHLPSISAINFFS